MSFHRSIGVWLALTAAICFEAVSFAPPALAGGGDCTQNVTEGASVAQPIAVVNVTGIDFGRVITGSAPGTVTVSATGTATASLTAGGPTVYAGSVLIDPSPASFYVTGEPGYFYNITTPSTCTVSNGSATMTVTLAAPAAATVDGHAASGQLSGTSSKIASNGYDAWVVGGTLSVGANQGSGGYSGTFSVEVDYQ